MSEANVVLPGFEDGAWWITEPARIAGEYYLRLTSGAVVRIHMSVGSAVRPNEARSVHPIPSPKALAELHSRPPAIDPLVAQFAGMRVLTSVLLPEGVIMVGTGPASLGLLFEDRDHVTLAGRTVNEGTEAMEIVELLRAHEGASVTILCDNPEATDGDELMAVEVCDEWTGWEERRFHGRSPLEALRAAKAAHDDPVPPKVKP